MSNPDLRLHIHIADAECTLCLDSSGESLHRRGYRQESVEAPINEVLAAGIIMMTGWQGDCDFIDPMCGSGTFLIEAALIARNMAPGLFRKEYAFEKWPDFDADLFDEIYNDDSQEREFAHRIYGYDVDFKAVNTARQNVKAAGLSDCISVEQQDFKDFTQPQEKAVIVTNPPYGERISTPNLLETYRMIGERLKHQFMGNDAWILSYREECFEQIGLKPSIKIPLYNGSLECELRKYQLFDGKMKQFRSEGGTVKTDEEKRQMAQTHRFKKEREFKQRLTEQEENEEGDIRSFTFHRHELVKEDRGRRRMERGERRDDGGRQREDRSRSPAARAAATSDTTTTATAAATSASTAREAANETTNDSTMTKTKLQLLLLLAITALPMSAQKLFTLEDLNFGGRNYHSLRPQNMFLTWWGDQLVQTDVEECHLIDPKTGRKTLLFTLDEMNRWAESDGSTRQVRHLMNVTFPYPDKPLARVAGKHSTLLVDFKAKQTVWEDSTSAQQARDWSPQTRATAYVEDNQLYVADAQGRKHQLTTDGSSRDIVYGQSVHRDEFGISKGTFWSPDGQRLAFYRMDQSMVTDYPQVDIDPRVAEPAPDKYPMAGMNAHVVTVGIYDLQTDKTVYLQTPTTLGDVTAAEGDPFVYLTNISWSPDSKHIYIQELNRDQNDCRLACYDAATGSRLGELLSETSDKYVEPLHPIEFLPWDNDCFIMQSQKDGYNHIYLYNTRGECIRQLTSGPWVVMQVLGFNTKEKSIIIASNERHPLQRNIYAVNVKTGRRTLLDEGEGIHRGVLSASGTLLYDKWQTPTVPNNIDLVSTKGGKATRLLTAPDPWADFAQPIYESGTLKAADGTTDLYWRMVKPRDFDPAKKYPTVVYVYGGPHAHNVDASWHWASRSWETYMAQKGYIVFILDNRGSENRGRDFEQATFRQLGQVEMQDQMKGVELLRSLPYVDGDRLGVHGWSYGGYMWAWPEAPSSTGSGTR